MFVVVTEADYGGYDDIRAFSVRDAAVDYAESLGKRLNMNCITVELEDGKFVVVTEEWYGGHCMKSFATYEEAKEYRASLTDVDSLIVNVQDDITSVTG